MKFFEVLVVVCALATLVCGPLALYLVPGVLAGGSPDGLRQVIFLTGVFLVVFGRQGWTHLSAQIKEPPIYGGDLVMFLLVVFSASLCLVGSLQPVGVIIWVPAANSVLFVVTLISQSHPWSIGTKRVESSADFQGESV